MSKELTEIISNSQFKSIIQELTQPESTQGTEFHQSIGIGLLELFRNSGYEVDDHIPDYWTIRSKQNKKEGITIDFLSNIIENPNSCIILLF